MNCAWYLCRTSPQWLSLVWRLAPQTLPTADDTLSITMLDPTVMAGRLTMTQEAGVAIWSLTSPEQCAQVVPQLGRAVTQVGVVRTLQLAIVDPRLPASAKCKLQAWEILPIDNGERLARCLPLIRRYWQKTSRIDC